MSPRFLYLHGLASGPGSTKGVALRRHFASRGVELELLDINRPSLPHLRLSRILDYVGTALGGPGERAVLFGSSLGGIAAARLAEQDERVAALVLLAPGLRIAEQLRRGLGEAAFADWERTGWHPLHNYATGEPARIDFGFYLDAAEVDARGGGWPRARVPTLLVHGRADTTCDVELSRTWARRSGQVQLVEVDDGHELTSSIPLIAREAERFLAPWLSQRTR